MNAEQAQIMALQALAYLAADSEQMDRFAALSGMGHLQLYYGARRRP